MDTEEEQLNLSDNELLDKAEELIDREELDEAQSLLDKAETCGRKYYVQSKLFAKKDWSKEQRVQLEYAVNAEPDNHEYKEALEKLTELESKIFTDEDYYERVEQHLKLNETDFAQNDLNCVKQDSGRKHYLQSKIYQQKKWYNEQFKQLKKAVKAEPDNEEYKRELAKIKEFKKSGEFREYIKERRKRQMGDAGGVCAEGCCEACCEGSCYLCCTAICEGIGNGC